MLNLERKFWNCSKDRKTLSDFCLKVNPAGLIFTWKIEFKKEIKFWLAPMYRMEIVNIRTHLMGKTQSGIIFYTSWCPTLKTKFNRTEGSKELRFSAKAKGHGEYSPHSQLVKLSMLSQSIFKPITVSFSPWSSELAGGSPIATGICMCSAALPVSITKPREMFDR